MYKADIVMIPRSSNAPMSLTELRYMTLMDSRSYMEPKSTGQRFVAKFNLNAKEVVKSSMLLS